MSAKGKWCLSCSILLPGFLRGRGGIPTHQPWRGSISYNAGLAWAGSHTLPPGVTGLLTENSVFLGCQEASLLRKMLRWTVTQETVPSHPTEVQPGPKVGGDADWV